MYEANIMIINMIRTYISRFQVQYAVCMYPWSAEPRLVIGTTFKLWSSKTLSQNNDLQQFDNQFKTTTASALKYKSVVSGTPD